MAKGKKTPAGSSAAADSSAADAGSGAAIDVLTMLTNRLNSMQTDLKKAQDDIVSSTRSAQQSSQFGAIATGQDVGADEAQKAGIAMASGSERTLNNFMGWQAVRFADRDRVHFDNMQALTALAFGNVAFASALCQTLATARTHGQK